MLRPLLSHEWRLLRTAPAPWLALGLLVAAVFFGLYNGSRWVGFQQSALADAHATEAETYATLAQRAATPDDQWPDPADAAYIGTFYGRTAALPPAPLALLAVGQSDVAPYNLYISGKTLALAHMKAAEELGNPQAYVTGRFDLAFALVVVLPLVLLALLFDVVSGERERGTLRLVLAQPVSPEVFVWAKAGLRWALVVGVTWGACLAGLVLFGAEPRAALGPLALTLLAIALYAAAWATFAVWVATRGWGSTTNALVMAAAWVAAVVVIPGLIAFASKHLQPVPSRAALIEAQRDAQTHYGEQGGELLLAYYDDNPGTRPADFDPNQREFSLFYTAIQGAVNDTLAPLLHRYEQALTAQERLAGGLALASPAALLQNVLTAAAGTDHTRHAAYLQQVASFHAAHRAFFVPRAYSRTPLTPADYAAMPRFVFEEPEGRFRRILWPLGALLLFTSALAWLARPGLRQLAVHG